ncbi:RNA methyltransferase [Luminiphilus sp.]|nr:RNA methyltransferase [Luminiphilus sp.]
MNSNNIQVVLVNPSHPGNIGAVARAMKNMGLRKLVLVDPHKFPDPEAQWRSASAVDIIDSARVVSSLDEAIKDSQFVVGTSARDRRIPWPVQDARLTARRIVDHSVSENVSILFGREDSGLNNEELKRCNLHCHIPTHPDYESLNLSMAVQIVCYEIRMTELEGTLPREEDSDWENPFATAQDMEYFFEHLEATLVDLDFLNPAAPKRLMTRLRRLFTRVRLDEMEVQILRGVLKEARRVVGENRNK